MAAEDDKKFDAVLGGFLVNDLRIRAGDLHCPESDTLAAYHERSLLPEEMNLWKEHVVGCARCQAILAELEATDSVALQVTGQEDGLTAAAVGAKTAHAQSSPRNEPRAALPQNSRVTPISRVRWPWLAPAGAIAAGLLVWVALHEKQLPPKTPTEIKTAKLEAPATPPPPLTHDDRQSLAVDEIARASKDQGTASEAVLAKPAPEAKILKPFEKPGSRGRLSRSEPLANKETRARADSDLESLSAANRAQDQPAQDGKAPVPGALSQAVGVPTLAANAQPQNLQAQQNQLNEREVSGPNPSRKSEKAKKSKAESPPLEYRAAAAAPVLAPPVPAPSAFNDVAALRMASEVSPYVISAPGKKTLWRVGHLGMIEFSSDGGASWARQISNVAAELTAGSAPSDKVCWIVGRAGTILLTKDAGSLWSVVHSPLDQEDVGGVRATDALHAVIWNLGNTKLFETSDGGLTWKPAASQ